MKQIKTPVKPDEHNPAQSNNIPSIFSNSSFNNYLHEEVNSLALGPKSVPDFGKLNLLGTAKKQPEDSKFSVRYERVESNEN